MGTIIICIIIFFIVFLVIIDDYSIKAYFLSIFGGLIIGPIIGFIIAFALPSKREVIKTTFFMESFEDTTFLNEHFFLGCDLFEDEMKYFFYYKKDSFDKLGVINYKYSKIEFINDSLKPRVEEIKTTDMKCFKNYFAFDADEVKYIIYVPKNKFILYDSSGKPIR